jgi:hypothetical protein
MDHFREIVAGGIRDPFERPMRARFGSLDQRRASERRPDVLLDRVPTVAPDGSYSVAPSTLQAGVIRARGN